MNMLNRRTKLYIRTKEGDVLIDNFDNVSCLKCILLNGESVCCPIEDTNMRLAYIELNDAVAYICDNKEKTKANFNQLVNMSRHSFKFIVEKWQEIRQSILVSKKNQVDTLKHNIEHINSNSINEFYTFISQDELLRNHKQMIEIIKEKLKDNKDSGAKLIARLARHNLNIKTELSVATKLNNPDSIPNYSSINPRNAIMTNIYMLYPDFKKRNIYVQVDEFRNRITSDFEAIQVATYYVIENASKYAKENSHFQISFDDTPEELKIVFLMNSLYIDEEDENNIFTEGYKGTQAIKSGKTGKGIGLYRARKLLMFCNSQIHIEPGSELKKSNDLYYSDNKFVITIPKVPSL